MNLDEDPDKIVAVVMAIIAALCLVGIIIIELIRRGNF